MAHLNPAHILFKAVSDATLYSNSFKIFFFVGEAVRCYVTVSTVLF